MRSFRHLLALLLTTVAATLGLVVASTGPAAACSCVGGDIPQYAERADVVFTGELASAPDLSEEQTITYTFEVERVYEGTVSAVAEVRTGAEGSACGLDYVEEGRRFVIFAVRYDGALTTGLCSGSTVANAAYTIRLERQLGAGADPARDPATRRDDGNPAADGGVPTWMVVVLGATGTAIVAGLAVGAARLRRQDQSVS